MWFIQSCLSVAGLSFYVRWFEMCFLVAALSRVFQDVQQVAVYLFIHVAVYLFIHVGEIGALSY